MPLRGAALWAVLALGAPGGAGAEVVDAIRWRSYPVPVLEGRSLRSALNAASPVRRGGETYHAYTRWNLRWELRWFEERGGRCSLTSVRTTLDAEVLLPEVGPAGVRAWPAWPAYAAALRVHEQGHLELGRAAAHRVDRRIADLAPAVSCALLESRANEIGREELESARRDESAYDRETGHGRTQGAWLH